MEGNYNLKIKWRDIFSESDWEIYLPDGNFIEVDETDERVTHAKTFLFNLLIKDGELCHGIILEDCSMGWAFTRQYFLEGRSNGQKEYLYREIGDIFNSKDNSTFRLNFDYNKILDYQEMTKEQEHYELTTEDTPYKVVRKIAGYLEMIKENL